MSRCAGAGREEGQPDSQADQWKYSIPYMSCSVDEWELVEERESFCTSSFFEFKPSLVQEFEFLWEFPKIHGFKSSSVVTRGLTESVMGW